MDYQNPQIATIYELANPLGEDADFYIGLTGPQSSSVLDLGCGTGTLCCALAQRGHRVTGVDPAAAMLAIARTKPYAQRVEWIESSAQMYRSRQHYDFIFMTGHTFQTLLTDADILAVLETMNRHISQRGRIVFETRNPRVNWAGEWTGRSRALIDGKITETLEVTGVDAEFISFQTSYRVPDGTLTTQSRLRFPSREQVETLIARSGLLVCEVFGDWRTGPFDAQSSREMVFVVEPRRLGALNGLRRRPSTTAMEAPD